MPGYIVKPRIQKFFSVLHTEDFVQLICRQYDPSVKFLHQLADLLHMTGAVGAAHQSSSGLQHTADLGKGLWQVFRIKEQMVGNHQIKEIVFKWDFLAVKSGKRKAGILGTDFSLCIVQHTVGNIRKDDGYFRWKLRQIFVPQSTVSAAKLQDLHAFMDKAFLIQPGKPALFVGGKQTVKLDPGGNIACVLVLGLHRLFHVGKVDQIQHVLPVNVMVGAYFLCGISNGFFYQLKLGDPVPNQLLLQLKRAQKKLGIRIIHSHAADFIQGKSQIF